MENINIGKNDLYKINENDIYFMSIPGRMGDEDGVTIITKDFSCYRIEGLMYPKSDSVPIKFSDLEDAFPLWKEAVKSDSETSKYKKIYMGFGNALCVDKTIYEEFMVYLNDSVKNNELHDELILDNGEYNPAIYFSSWLDAVNKMMEDKKSSI